VAEASPACDASATVSASDQLTFTLGPTYVVEVIDRFTPGLTDAREDRTYTAPPQPRDAAVTLAALLLGAGPDPAGDGPWHRALAGGRRTVRLIAQDAREVA
jgi:hypothetical protein